MPGKLKVVVYTPSLAIARGLIATLTSEGSKAYLFTNIGKCREYIKANIVDLLYVCVANPKEEIELSDNLLKSSKNRRISLLFHYADEEADASTAVGSASYEPLVSSMPEEAPNEEAATPDKVQHPLHDNPDNAAPIQNDTTSSGQSTSKEPTPAIATEAAKVLLAEDDRSIAKLLTFKLEESGFNVLHVTDGQAALDRARDFKPNLIVLDVMMPKYTGTEVAKILRMDDEFTRTPILIITASTSEDIEKDALKGGADRFMRKPFHLTKFVETAKTLVDISRQK